MNILDKPKGLQSQRTNHTRNKWSLSIFLPQNLYKHTTIWKCLGPMGFDVWGGSILCGFSGPSVWHLASYSYAFGVFIIPNWTLSLFLLRNSVYWITTCDPIFMCVSLFFFWGYIWVHSFMVSCYLQNIDSCWGLLIFKGKEGWLSRDTFQLRHFVECIIFENMLQAGINDRNDQHRCHSKI